METSWTCPGCKGAVVEEAETARWACSGLFDEVWDGDHFDKECGIGKSRKEVTDAGLPVDPESSYIGLKCRNCGFEFVAVYPEDVEEVRARRKAPDAKRRGPPRVRSSQ